MATWLTMIVPHEEGIQHTDSKDCWCEPTPALAIEESEGKIVIDRYDYEINKHLMPNEYVVWFHMPKNRQPPKILRVYGETDES